MLVLCAILSMTSIGIMFLAVVLRVKAGLVTECANKRTSERAKNADVSKRCMNRSITHEESLYQFRYAPRDSSAFGAVDEFAVIDPGKDPIETLFPSKNLYNSTHRHGWLGQQRQKRQPQEAQG
jgi:hypothetical protein